MLYLLEGSTLSGLAVPCFQTLAADRKHAAPSAEPAGTMGRGEDSLEALTAFG